MRCDVLVTVEDGQDNAGSISFENGKFKLAPRPGYEQMLDSVFNGSVYTDTGEEVERDKDPQRWMSLLPKKYDGARVRVAFKR